MCGLSSARLQGTLLSPSMVTSNPVSTQDRQRLALRALCSGAEVGMPWPAPCSPGCSAVVGCTEVESTRWLYTAGMAQAGTRVAAAAMGGGDAEARARGNLCWQECPSSQRPQRHRRCLAGRWPCFLEGRAQAKDTGMLELCCPQETCCLMKQTGALGATCWPRS